MQTDISQFAVVFVIVVVYAVILLIADHKKVKSE